MPIQLSDHFNYRRLLRFTLPAIVMMVFTSIYGVVDGLFVSNFVGTTSFAAVNLIWPVIMIFCAVGFMFGTGGSALIAITMGAGDETRARGQFSLIVYATLAVGLLLSGIGYVALPRIAVLLGATGQLLDDCVLYGRILMLALPFQMVQVEFQSFFVTAEKPNLGLWTTVAAGCTNIVLDALLVAVIPCGLPGAAAATALSQTVGGIIPLVYFGRKNSSRLRLGRPVRALRDLARAAGNGSSEMMSNVSMSLVSMLYNMQLMGYAGEAGVAAYGVLMYVNFVFLAIFIGYSVGVAPVIGYHYGAGNRDELQGLFRRSLIIIGVTSVAMLAAGQLLSTPLSRLFVGHDASLCAMTERAFTIFAFSFLFAGFAIFGSAFFTALGDGLTSAIVSFMRTLLFQVAAVLVLPMFWELDGIWGSTVVAEIAAVAVNVVFLVAKRQKYGYWG